MQDKLWKHKIVLMSQFKVPLMFHISKIYESRNKKIMQFEVRFSYFIIIIKVLNICPKDGLNFQLKNWVNSGVYGAVYEVEINNVKYAVKKMSLNKHSMSKDIKNAIEEYCIMKLCNALQIGPAFRSLFGFDLIVTGNSVFFSCEMGLSIYDYAKVVSNHISEFEAQFQKLEYSLMLMHSLGIIHNDIKPNNIIYSQEYKKFCFIDFGLSEVTQCPLGSYKKVKPRGSIYYCSEDMKKLFFDDFSQGQVDLYHNDMIALQKSKQNILSNIKSQQRISSLQQRQINSKKDYQIINDNYNVLVGIKGLAFQQHQKNYENNNGDIKQVKLINHDQVNLEMLQSQIQSLLILKLIYFLQEKKVSGLQQLFKVNKESILRILSTNLKKISFIFFQSGKSPALHTIYKKLLSHLQKSDRISNQTIETVQFKLEPYFRNTIDRQCEQSNIIVAKYLVEQKQSRQMICNRYEQGHKLFYNQGGMFDINLHNVHKVQKQIKRPLKQIKIQLTYDRKEDIKLILKELQILIDQADLSFLKQMICFHVAKIDFYRVWAQVTQAQLSHFELVLNKLGLRIYFESKNNLQQQVKISYSEKYIFYLQLFMEFYLKKVQQYRLHVIVANFIIRQIPSQTNIDMRVFRDLYKIDESQSEVQKNNDIDINDNDLIEYYKFYPEDYFQVFQLCMNIIDRLIKTLDGFLQYESNIEMNTFFAKIMDDKIRSLLLIQLILIKNIGQRQPKETIYVTAHYLNKMLLTKCVEFRRRTICQKLSKAQQFNDFYTVVQSYESLYNIWDFMRFDQEPLKSQVQNYQLKNYLDHAMKKVLESSDSWYKIEKQLFEVIIYTALIPLEEYQKFNFLKKYYDIFRRQKSRKDRRKKGSYAQFYALSKTFKLAIQIDDFNTIINIFQYAQSKKSYVMNPRFTYSIYYFFKKCNNSKKIKQCLKSMSSFRKMWVNDDVQHFYFQQRVTNIAFSTINKEKNPCLLAKTYYQRDEFINIFTQKQDKQYFFNNIIPQPTLYRACIQLIKQWKSVIQKDNKNRQLQSRLFNLRFILKRTFFSSGNLSILFKYLSKQYQLQIQNYENALCRKIQFLRQRKQIQSQIWKFFGQQCLNEDEYWQKVKLSFILLTRSRLLSEITKNIDVIDSHQVHLILNEWQVFDLAIKKVASIESVNKQDTSTSKYRSLMTYYEIRTKVSRVIYLHALSGKLKNETQEEQNSFIQSKKVAYINFFIQYLKRAMKRYEKLSNKVYSPGTQFKYFQTAYVMKNTISILAFRCEQPFMDLLTDCCQGTIQAKDVQKELGKHKIFKDQFHEGFILQQQLKQCFFDIVKSQSIHMFFYLYHFRIRFLENLIQLGVKLILQGKKQEEFKFYFLTFMFYHICSFVKKYNCSSYSYLVVGIINTFQQKLLSRIFEKIKQDYQQEHSFDEFSSSNFKQKNIDIENLKNLISKLRLITLFEIDIIKFLIQQAKQSKIQHTVLILLSCERVKFQIIFFLSKNKLFLQNMQGNSFQGDLNMFRKIQYVICRNCDKLEYLAKIFFRHTFYCYLIIMNLSDKKLKIFENPLSRWLAFDNLKKGVSKHFYRYLQIKHFRTTRRISTTNQEKQQKRRLVFFLEQKYYHLIFEPINQESLRRIPIFRPQKLEDSKNPYVRQWDSISIKTLSCLRSKVKKYLLNSCSSEL